MNNEREDLKPERKRFKLFQLRWNEPLGKPECPYAHRYVFNFGLFALRLHVWHRSDDKRYFHDHPYSFLTIILKGKYRDVSPVVENKTTYNKIETLSFGSIRFRKAEYAHYVDVPKGGCISFLITFKPRRDWGFWVDNKLKRPLKYFHKYGHPPCDEQ